MKHAFLLLLFLLAGCETPGAAVDEATAAVEATTATTQNAVAEAITSPLLSFQNAVQEALPEPASDACTMPIVIEAVNLIIRWEISSPQTYERKYRRPIWPGGASGVTWGVGYDGGHQTPITIGRDWSFHPHVTDLRATSGITGTSARALTRTLQHVDVPYGQGAYVFGCSTLPAYTVAARRALGPKFDQLPKPAQGTLVSLGYNRGWSMKGDKRAEMKVIRDVCVEALDTHCIAEQLVAMCRIWANTPNATGLCNRRRDEARLAVS